MSKPVEQRLRDIFTDEAGQAPVATALAEETLRVVRQRRRIRLVWTTFAAVVTVVVASALGVGLLRSHPAGTAGPSAIGQRPHGALPVATSCVAGYSLKALAKRAFAFDGVVTAIGPARTNRPGAELPFVAATFHVKEWYRGGSGKTVTVDLARPRKGASVETPSYQLGTRLLVSGEPRWGGAPLADAIAWGCGFTRYYDPATAKTWRAVFR